MVQLGASNNLISNEDLQALGIIEIGTRRKYRKDGAPRHKGFEGGASTSKTGRESDRNRPQKDQGALYFKRNAAILDLHFGSASGALPNLEIDESYFQWDIKSNRVFLTLVILK